METGEHQDDIRAIEALVERQFASLAWQPGTSADWSAFVADFFPGASLYPSARPAKRQGVEAFVERMKGLAGTELRSFHECALGSRSESSAMSRSRLPPARWWRMMRA
jgi:hypothetical protein